jgi:hypothetical protein
MSVAARLPFEYSMQAICRKLISPSSKTRLAVELETVTVLFIITFAKRTRILGLEIAMYAEVSPLPVMESGRATG